MFRSVRTVLVPRVLLLHCNNTTVSKTPLFGSVQTSNLRYFSTDVKPAPEPPAAAKSKVSLVVENFSFFSTFQQWKNQFLPQEEKESSIVDAEGKESSTVDAEEKESSTVDVDAVKKKTPPSAIDLALNSVVKVFTVSSEPRLWQPWQISMQEESSGSGFVISGKKIITNAHVVDNHTSVKVRKHGSTTKYKAKVRAIGHECDLAILEIDNEEFWEGMNVLELGDIPSLDESVAVVGYPCGGDNVSVTKGVVSRVEPRTYCHSSIELLAIQIDAAINPGNSGGPVIMGNKVAGVAFQSSCWYESLNYIIPTPVIQHFLDGVEESGQPVKFCSMDLSYQTMENFQIRNYFKMSKDMTGILVNKINPLSDAHKFLKKYDVILSIDGVPIGNNSTVPFRKQERITFRHLVSMKKPSETALFKVLREGKEYEFNISLKPVQRLVPTHHFDKVRSYYIFGGFVFVPLSQPYITGTSRHHSKKMAKKPGDQIVIISQILEDDINADYAAFEDLQVKKVNGVEVDNLKHLCQLIEECSTVHLSLELEKDKILPLNYSSAKRATAKIMKELKIPSAMSDDLLPKQRNSGRTRVTPRQSKKK